MLVNDRIILLIIIIIIVREHELIPRWREGGRIFASDAQHPGFGIYIIRVFP